MKRKKKKNVRLLIAAMTVVLIAISFGAVKSWIYLSDNKLNNFSGDADVYVYPETRPEDVITQLDTQLVIKRKAGLQRTFKAHSVDRYITPGHYVVKSGQTSVYVARMLNNGWQTPVKLTLSGTMRRRADIARKISNQLLVDSVSMRKALSDPELLSKFGFKPSNVFSLIIPDTYEIYWTASPEEVLECQKKAYDSFWTQDREAKAKALGLSRLEVSVLASIVKGESNYDPELPKIAGVYLNRLHKGMKLQADPTVAFCYDYKVNRILTKMLDYDSPYNTYRYAGLPPGPIYVPTKACLDAVLNPETSQGYLYFCADPSFNGTHRFSASYSEHLKNARAFQAALDARK